MKPNPSIAYGAKLAAGGTSSFSVSDTATVCEIVLLPNSILLTHDRAFVLGAVPAAIRMARTVPLVIATAASNVLTVALRRA